VTEGGKVLHHRYSPFICSVDASVLLLTPLFARGRPSFAWKVYKLHKDVEACTFAPDGSHVADAQDFATTINMQGGSVVNGLVVPH
jgi:hypothetical protein